MRKILFGVATIGSLLAGGIAATSAAPLSLAPVGPQAAVHQADWASCGPRCQAHRQAERERALEQRRMAEHRRWEHQRWQESHRYPAPNAYQRY